MRGGNYSAASLHQTVCHSQYIRWMLHSPHIARGCRPANVTPALVRIVHKRNLHLFLCTKAGRCFFTTSTDVGRFSNFHNCYTDELPVPRFRVNLLRSPVIQAPNRVALDLEVVAANFGHAAIQSPQFICYSHTPARRRDTHLGRPNRLPTNHSWTLWTGGCTSSQ